MFDFLVDTMWLPPCCRSVWGHKRSDDMLHLFQLFWFNFFVLVFHYSHSHRPLSHWEQFGFTFSASNRNSPLKINHLSAWSIYLSCIPVSLNALGKYQFRKIAKMGVCNVQNKNPWINRYFRDHSVATFLHLECNKNPRTHTGSLQIFKIRLWSSVKCTLRPLICSYRHSTTCLRFFMFICFSLLLLWKYRLLQLLPSLVPHLHLFLHHFS